MEREELEQLEDKLRGWNYFKNSKKCAQLDVAFYRFYDLYYIFASGNLNLANADDEKLTLGSIETNNDKVVRMFLRSEYLKSCILSYNSIEDYVMQILAVTLKLKIKVRKDKYKYIDIVDIEQFRKDIRKINYLNVLGALKKSKYESVRRIVEKYHRDTEKLRDLSNKIKHTGNIRFAELPKPNYERFKESKMNGEYMYDFSSIEPEEIHMSEVINLCYELNPIIKKYIEDIYDILDKKYDLKMLNEYNN